MIRQVRLGIIGLGRRWRRRYGPALRELQDHFEVRALCDEVHQRAVNEAHRLGCEAASGPTEVLEREDVEAGLLLDPPWYRLWPLEVACRVGKPVFCCATPDLDEVHADELCRQVRESRLPVMLEMSLRLAPATDRLSELLETRLGPARTVCCDLVHSRPEPDRSSDGSAPSPLIAGGVGLLDWCASLLGGAPTSVLAGRIPGAGLATLLLDFGDGRAAQVTCWRVPGARRTLRLRVGAARGAATVVMPRRLCWTDADGRHTHRLPLSGQAVPRLLQRFHLVVDQGIDAQPSFEDACRVLDWLRAAARSAGEGRRVDC
jgi:predicted dehydrogenase